MTLREAVHELIDGLDDEALEVLFAELSADDADVPEQPYLDGRQYPSLEAIWNNESDAIFDRLFAE